MARELLMGNAVIGLAAIGAGVGLVAGYPGTPSTEILETVAAHNPNGRIHVEWATNEKAALEVAAGASYAGMRCLVTCKQVGLNVASDALMSLVYIGVGGGVVIAVADDPGPISSQTEQDTRRFGEFAKLPVLDPATPEECAKLVPYAFDLSERYATPVILRPTTRICHAYAGMEPPTPSDPIAPAGFDRDPKWVIFPPRALKGHHEINARMPKIAAEFCKHPANTAEDLKLAAWAYGVATCAEDAAAGGVADAGGATADAAATSVTAAAGGATTGTSAPAGVAVKTRYAIFASGVSHGYAREAIASGGFAQGRDIQLVRIGTPVPFPDDFAARVLAGADEAICFEELDSVVEDNLLRVIGARHLATNVHGKRTGDAKDAGENSVESVLTDLASFFAKMEGAAGGTLAETPTQAAAASASEAEAHAAPAPAPDSSSDSDSSSGFDSAPDSCPASGVAAAPAPDATAIPTPPLPVRPPVLCAGCPHRASFYAFKKALRGQKVLYAGDIGCYTLGNAAPLNTTDTCLCMGAGITIAQGAHIAEPDAVNVAFVGDSTFFASGITGIVNAKYNRTKLIVAVLDNSTTAMTGMQPHPGTGLTMMGERHEPISIPAILKAIGISCVLEVDPLDLEASVAAIKQAAAEPEVSAVIFKSPCTHLIKQADRCVVNSGRCTGCRACVRQLGCPAFAWTGQKLRIDPALCYGCSLCAQVCGFGAISCAKAPAAPAQAAAQAQQGSAASPAPPAPAAPATAGALQLRSEKGGGAL